MFLRRRGRRVAEATLSAEEQKKAEALLKLGEGGNGP
jgi:hypothetical protein